MKNKPSYVVFCELINSEEYLCEMKDIPNLMG